MRRTGLPGVGFTLTVDKAAPFTGLSPFEPQEFTTGGLETQHCCSPSTTKGFCVALPLRFSDLPVRRKLIRMMLLLEKARFQLTGQPGERGAFFYVADYLRSLMDTAIARDELRYRPAEEMVGYFFSLVGGVGDTTNTGPRPNIRVRSEVRRRVAIFLQKYATEKRR